MKVKPGDKVTFTGVSWDMPFEFERAVVVYSPVCRFADSSVYELVEDICRDLCQGEIDDELSILEADDFYLYDWSLEEIERKPGYQRILATFFEEFEYFEGRLSFTPEKRLSFTLESLDASNDDPPVCSPAHICDRCHNPFEGFETVGMTAGYYRADAWPKFANPGEVMICDSCMWHDQRYIAIYGAIPRESVIHDPTYGWDTDLIASSTEQLKTLNIAHDQWRKPFVPTIQMDPRHSEPFLMQPFFDDLNTYYSD